MVKTSTNVITSQSTKTALDLNAAEVIADYRLCFMSRQASLIGRKEVLTGKAKFGIFGDGKEVAQVAMARAFRQGDWRSGYYRDQTFMMAVGELTLRQFFAQLYADTNIKHEPHSGGRQMNSHFATRYIDASGAWLDQMQQCNSSADLSPTAAQMARAVGLAYASKLYRGEKSLAAARKFSDQGGEVSFVTIGNASAAEGVFWESLNAAGTTRIPLAISVWDDGYGISVPNKYQMTKESISEATRGFARDAARPDLYGIDLYVVKGSDYPALVDTYRRGIARVRHEHMPALFHIIDLTQPQGHSTSGSHERYKSKERMAFEENEDCLRKMRAWMLATDIIAEEALVTLETDLLALVESERAAAWDDYLAPIVNERHMLLQIYADLRLALTEPELIAAIDDASNQLKRAPSLLRRLILSSARRSLLLLKQVTPSVKAPLIAFIDDYQQTNQDRYSRWTWSESERSPLKLPVRQPIYATQPSSVPGNEIIQACFDHLLARDPRVFIIGEDVGQLGGVNQEFKGLQEKYGELRVTDTGIREATILGQGIGAAMRGLRPVVDIQYLDYLLYCFQLLSDDLATLHFRSAGGQIAPVVIRTKGHRLEGIWHTGSPMGTIIHGLRGIHVCVPRNMVQAAGLYNTLFQGDDPGLVIEVLSGYRLREEIPENLGEFTVPLGVPDFVRRGKDITIVTYGACVRLAEEAAKVLEGMGVDTEIIDVQTLLPFDRYHIIGSSIEKTNAVLFFDEDVPGGATAYMLQQVLETQNVYDCLDAPPRTLTAKPHRSAYGSDGDYWCKPSVEDVIETIYLMMRERDPGRFADLRQ